MCELYCFTTLLTIFLGLIVIVLSYTSNAYADVGQSMWKPCQITWEDYIHNCENKHIVPLEIPMWCRVSNYDQTCSDITFESDLYLNDDNPKTNMSIYINTALFIGITLFLGVFVMISGEYCQNRQEEGNPIK